MRDATVERSYRALFAVPSIRRILVTMQIARIAKAMVGVAIVLFTLLEFRSPGRPGAALTGAFAATSLEGAIVVGVAACIVAAVIAARMIPREEPALAPEHADDRP